MAPLKKQSNEERLRKKLEAEKRRQEKIKNDPELLAIEKEKNHEKYLKRLQKGQRKLIGDQTSREKRMTRKKWKEATKKSREKKEIREAAEVFVQNNSPPDSEIELPAIPCKVDGRVSTGKKKIRKRNSKIYRDLIKTEKKLESANHEVKNANKKAEKYKPPYLRLLEKMKPKTLQLQDTPRTKVKKLLRGQKVSNLVKRKLVLGEFVCQSLQNKYKEVKKNSQKRLLRSSFDLKLMRTYKVKAAMNNIVGRETKAVFNKKYKRLQSTGIQFEVIQFLEREANSRLCPGRKNTKTKCKVKKQKRLLSKTMKDLHEEFVKETSKSISYSLFCRLKPYWILTPTVSDRDTCLCKIHDNMDMLVAKLYSLNVIDFDSPKELVKSLCCKSEHMKEDCLFRKCGLCKENMIMYSEYQAVDSIVYNKWVTETEEKVKKGKVLSVKKTKKKNINCTIGDAVEALEQSVQKYMLHCGNMNKQYLAVREKKESLNENEALVHIDFSENYNGKFAKEVQSVHFGSSRNQITLHTGVFYVKGKNPVSFCSVSESPDHKSAAVWAHLAPVLNHIELYYPEVSVLHFVSDSPSGQYRNKTMFYMIQNHLPTIFPGLTACTWNFSESGHGKGAPDGIGGLLKRTADRCVAEGKDIMDVEAFITNFHEKCPNVLLWHVTDDDVRNVQAIIDASCGNLQSFKGTMKVHQVTFDMKQKSEVQRFDYRALSCWKCSLQSKCSHYSIHVGPVETTSSIKVAELEKSDWVVVTYENQKYPGEVVESNSEYIMVSAMEPSGPKGWKWPVKPDIHNYPVADIVKIISPPVPCGNRASQYQFLENF